MSLDPAQLVLQLGIAGAMLFIGWKIATLLIEKWSIAEAARTKEIAEGFARVTGRVEAHHTADIQSHGELARGIAEIRGRLDEARWHREEFTPIGPIPQPPMRSSGLRSPRPGTHHDED